MIRRSFFQTLAAALLPQPLLAAAKSVQPGCEPPARALHSPAPIQDPEWLQEWREIPKLEIFAKDLPYHEDPHQRDLGEVILRHIGEGRPFTFRYTGGSEPGAVRTVLPTLLFSPDFCPYRMCYEDPTELPDPSQTPIYLLGWCLIRQAARTFRLDRMEIVVASGKPSGVKNVNDYR
jgi:predicted DNA-binding transcriptional regulator YafY